MSCSRKVTFRIIAVQADLPSQRYEVGEMFKFHLPSLNREIQGQYTEAGFPLVFSGVCMSLIEDECSTTEPFWQARICSVIVGVPRRDIEAAIRGLYPHQSIKRRGDLTCIMHVGWRV